MKSDIHAYSFDRWPRSLIVYTVAFNKADLSSIDIYRNSGIFHEPGGYALWLILAMGANTIITNTPWNKKNVVFCLALLTTFSTAGYLQVFILIFYFLLYSKTSISFKFLMITAFLGISYSIFRSADFMEEKMETHFEEQTFNELEGTYTTGRIIRIRKTLNAIQQSPIIGRGIITASAEEDKYSEQYVSGTSSLKVFAHFGLIFGSLFYLYYIRGIIHFIQFFNYKKTFAFFLFSSMFVGGLSQDFFMETFGIVFFLYGIFESRKILLYSYNKMHNKNLIV